jgi:hypothetical protein
MTVLAIDPGSEKSGVVLWAPGCVALAEVMANRDALKLIGGINANVLAIENVGHYGTGMPAGKTVFETCIWIGRFIQCWSTSRDEKSVRLVLRPTVKTHLCGSVKAKDANVRRAVIDRLGPPGTKKNPGITHGVTSHSMQALALALYVSDMERIAA